MKRYYLDKLGVHDRWDEWYSDDEKRKRKVKEQKKKYGFDFRECINLDETFYEWLYERLMAYKRDAFDVIDFQHETAHRWEYKGASFTQDMLINEAIRLLEEYFTSPHDWQRDENKALEASKIFVMILPCMWW